MVSLVIKKNELPWRKLLEAAVLYQAEDKSRMLVHVQPGF